MLPRDPQLELELRTWGGARKGAGRKPKGDKAGVPHAARPRIGSSVPAHVTIKLKRGLWDLRSTKPFAMLMCQIKSASTDELRIAHFSVQHDHVHLVIEAESNSALSRGVQGLSVRIAHHLNRLMKRTGSVFKDRYHARLLRTPTEVRNALLYLARNGLKHLQQIGREVARGWLDPCASLAALGPWCPELENVRPDAIVPAKPKSWLLRQGYTKAGPIHLSEISSLGAARVP